MKSTSILEAPTGLFEAGWPRIEAPDFVPEEKGRDRLMRLARSGLTQHLIPSEFGGIGGGLLEAAALQRVLGRVDPSTAIGFNMHTLSVGLLVEHWRRNRDTSWMLMEAIAVGDVLIASAFSERGGSPNLLRSQAVARACDRGFKVSGEKFPCSLATTARLVCFAAHIEHDPGQTIVALCPTSSPGISVGSGWNSVGMRGSDTASLRFDNVFVDRRLVFHRAPTNTVDEIVVDGIVWFVVLVAATYCGVLESMIATAMAKLPNRAARTLTSGLAGIAALSGATRDLAGSWRATGDSLRTGLMHAAGLRLELCRVVSEVSATVRSEVGSEAFSSDSPVGVALLDSLAVFHHPPSLALCHQILRAGFSGAEMSLDLEEQP